MAKKKLLKYGLMGLAGGLVLAQLVPYGRDHSNPPVLGEPAWDSPRTRELTVRACFDCHSNQTEWPWYSSVAPMSWMIQNHVNEGREYLNFSEWTKPQKEADEAADEVRSGHMPPKSYKLFHGMARLSDSERDELIRGLEATMGGAGSSPAGNAGEAANANQAAP